ncbi:MULTISPECIES: hypothetical protein, partial [unclassified Sphingomonas]|uniref:hypothetical protein n=1 Tax=unclassified Sphingomonas TaxID=196159 RepID=UPI001F40B2DD
PRRRQEDGRGNRQGDEPLGGADGGRKSGLHQPLGLLKNDQPFISMASELSRGSNADGWIEARHHMAGDQEYSHSADPQTRL